jgi:DNA-binding MarR family transcriptional regulator
MVDVSTREQSLREAIELFYFAYRSFTSEPDHMLTEQGLGRVHHRILYFVGRNPDVAVTALLDTLAVSKQALNAPLRKLRDDKLISIRTDEQDRRFRRLRLTEAGRKLEAQLTGTQMRHLEAVFNRTGGKNEQAWKSIMRAMPLKEPRG